MSRRSRQWIGLHNYYTGQPFLLNLASVSQIWPVTPNGRDEGSELLINKSRYHVMEPLLTVWLLMEDQELSDFSRLAGYPLDFEGKED